MTDRAPREGLRRALHVLTGTTLGACALGLPAATTSIMMAAVLAVIAVLEVARRLSPPLHDLLVRLSFGAMRPSESRGITGATVLALGLAAAWFAFPASIAGRAMLVTAVADPAAATIGTALAPPGRKTLAGTLACAFAAAAVLLLLQTPPFAAAVAAFAAAIAERVPSRALDNLSVPLVTGAVLALLR